MVRLVARRTEYPLGYKHIITYSYRVTRVVYGKRLLAMEKDICGHFKIETCGLQVQWIVSSETNEEQAAVSILAYIPTDVLFHGQRPLRSTTEFSSIAYFQPSPHKRWIHVFSRGLVFVGALPSSGCGPFSGSLTLTTRPLVWPGG